MTGPTAFAQTAQPPKRILFYFTGNGFPPHHWRVNTSAETTPTAGLTLSRILAPLDPVKDQPSARSAFRGVVPMKHG